MFIPVSFRIDSEAVDTEAMLQGISVVSLNVLKIGEKLPRKDSPDTYVEDVVAQSEAVMRVRVWQVRSMEHVSYEAIQSMEFIEWFKGELEKLGVDVSGFWMDMVTKYDDWTGWVEYAISQKSADALIAYVKSGCGSVA